MAGRDPYQVLEVSATASDEELRAAYRRLVQRHHPDHNGGSADAARRFEEVQDAYAQVLRMRRAGARAGPGAAAGAGSGAAAGAGSSGDPEVDARIADLERQVREARQARERAQRAAAQAAAAGGTGKRSGTGAAKRPSDEELGYYKTDDSFSKLFDDAAAELSQRLAETGSRTARKRVADLLDGLSEKLSGNRRRPEK